MIEENGDDGYELSEDELEQLLDKFKSVMESFLSGQKDGTLINSDQECIKCGGEWSTPLNLEGINPTFICPDCGHDNAEDEEIIP